jgi:hypothetical protein
MRKTSLLVSSVSGLLLACSAAMDPAPVPSAAQPEARVCADHSATRNVFWGDLHVHTGISRDAWLSDVRTSPDDAYRFARGEEIMIPPMSDSGRATQKVRIDRPLDFAAVTDHAEGMGTMAICADSEHPASNSEWCGYFRRLPPHPGFGHPPDLPPSREIFEGICGGPGLPLCQEARSTPWRTIQQAAARWNDTSSECSFTTFLAYEWSGARGGPLLHRNVIFRNAVAPLPVSSQWDPTPHDLWRRLEAECTQAGNGCDVLAIPHNSNTSQGTMFAPEYPGAESAEDEARQARRRPSWRSCSTREIPSAIPEWRAYSGHPTSCVASRSSSRVCRPATRSTAARGCSSTAPARRTSRARASPSASQRSNASG